MRKEGRSGRFHEVVFLWVAKKKPKKKINEPGERQHLTKFWARRKAWCNQ